MKAQQLITGDCTQFNETREKTANKWTNKFREPSFRDRLVVGFTIAITVAPLLFLIGMYVNALSFYW